MHPIYIALIALGGLMLFLALLGLYMIWPGGRRKEMKRFTEVKYAHRGMHTEGVAENSLTAFRRAKDNGFGIELDVRLSGDGELVVFHDDTLTRVAGVEGKVIDYTAEELSKMSLSGTSDGIPTFRQVLELIDGAVPLLIEIKMGTGESGVAEKLVDVIEGYKGEYIVESFNPLALRVIRRLRPDILRGILSDLYMKDPKYKGKLIYRLSQNLMLNFIMRPNFIAYSKRGYYKPALKILGRIFRTPLITWTVKSKEEEREAYEHGFDAVIFKDYVPEK